MKKFIIVIVCILINAGVGLHVYFNLGPGKQKHQAAQAKKQIQKEILAAGRDNCKLETWEIKIRPTIARGIPTNGPLPPIIELGPSFDLQISTRISRKTGKLFHPLPGISKLIVLRQTAEDPQPVKVAILKEKDIIARAKKSAIRTRSAGPATQTFYIRIPLNEPGGCSNVSYQVKIEGSVPAISEQLPLNLPPVPQFECEKAGRHKLRVHPAPNSVLPFHFVEIPVKNSELLFGNKNSVHIEVPILEADNNKHCKTYLANEQFGTLPSWSSTDGLKQKQYRIRRLHSIDTESFDCTPVRVSGNSFITTDPAINTSLRRINNRRSSKSAGWPSGLLTKQNGKKYHFSCTPYNLPGTASEQWALSLTNNITAQLTNTPPISLPAIHAIPNKSEVMFTWEQPEYEKEKWVIGPYLLIQRKEPAAESDHQESEQFVAKKTHIVLLSEGRFTDTGVIDMSQTYYNLSIWGIAESSYWSKTLGTGSCLKNNVSTLPSKRHFPTELFQRKNPILKDYRNNGPAAIALGNGGAKYTSISPGLRRAPIVSICAATNSKLCFDNTALSLKMATIQGEIEQAIIKDLVLSLVPASPSNPTEQQVLTASPDAIICIKPVLTSRGEHVELWFIDLLQPRFKRISKLMAKDENALCDTASVIHKLKEFYPIRCTFPISTAGVVATAAKQQKSWVKMLIGDKAAQEISTGYSQSLKDIIALARETKDRDQAIALLRAHQVEASNSDLKEAYYRLLARLYQNDQCYIDALESYQAIVDEVKNLKNRESMLLDMAYCQNKLNRTANALATIRKIETPSIKTAERFVEYGDMAGAVQMCEAMLPAQRYTSRYPWDRSALSSLKEKGYFDREDALALLYYLSEKTDNSRYKKSFRGKMSYSPETHPIQSLKAYEIKKKEGATKFDDLMLAAEANFYLKEYDKTVLDIETCLKTNTSITPEEKVYAVFLAAKAAQLNGNRKKAKTLYLQAAQIAEKATVSSNIATLSSILSKQASLAHKEQVPPANDLETVKLESKNIRLTLNRVGVLTATKGEQELWTYNIPGGPVTRFIQSESVTQINRNMKRYKHIQASSSRILAINYNDGIITCLNANDGAELWTFSDWFPISNLLNEPGKLLVGNSAGELIELSEEYGEILDRNFVTTTPAKFMIGTGYGLKLNQEYSRKSKNGYIESMSLSSAGNLSFPGFDRYRFSNNGHAQIKRKELPLPEAPRRKPNLKRWQPSIAQDKQHAPTQKSSVSRAQRLSLCKEMEDSQEQINKLRALEPFNKKEFKSLIDAVSRNSPHLREYVYKLCAGRDLRNLYQNDSFMRLLSGYPNYASPHWIGVVVDYAEWTSPQKALKVMDSYSNFTNYNEDLITKLVSDNDYLKLRSVFSQQDLLKISDNRHLAKSLLYHISCEALAKKDLATINMLREKYVLNESKKHHHTYVPIVAAFCEFGDQQTVTAVKQLYFRRLTPEILAFMDSPAGISLALDGLQSEYSQYWIDALQRLTGLGDSYIPEQFIKQAATTTKGNN